MLRPVLDAASFPIVAGVTAVAIKDYIKSGMHYSPESRAIF